ncbi:hypothetical protein SAPIO_CDS1554 [Scedosporium apiospermum]|uniref:Deacetylase sirtuin-type domain-containing protein n=1 Tax=Pseudallescheria apiosperma TaxID=563466 RepID=A0A084GEJ3_PSEDA|nr:uncharacterized protein SAPIO_CDS1554 [Scedosporium apiospermum]KEZ45755.1 hypothetical protein SAPIO_CDS1554 [Scedosporium apiospermum]
MPTAHVRPGDDEALQIIANALVKARKVVVVTGAGISTNSGIPDFRSENGLYQLIQAQYEAAARQATQSQLPAPALKPADSNSRDDASNVDEFPSHRPSKRRKLSTATKEEIGAPGTSETSEANSSAESGGIGRHRADRKTRSRLELPNATDREKLGSLLIKQEPSELPNTSSTAPAPTCDDSFNTSSQDDQRTRVDNDDQARQNPELPQDNGDATFSTRPSGPAPSAPLFSTPSRPRYGKNLVMSPQQPPTSSSDICETEASSSDATPKTLTESKKKSDSPRPSSAGRDKRAAFQHVAYPYPELTLRERAKLFPRSPGMANLLQGKNLREVNEERPKVSEEEMELATETMEMIGNIKTCLVNLHLHAREMNSPFAQEVLRRPRLNWMADVIQVMEGDIQQYLGNQAETTKNQPETPEAKDDETLEEPSERATSPSRTEIPVMVPSPSMTEILLDALERQKDKKSPLQKPMSEQTVGDEADVSTTRPPKQLRQSSPSSGVECVFLHGSLESLRCFVCRKLCEWEDADRENETLSGRQPECPHCAGATAARQERGKRALGVGKLRPDIVLYGEEHPNAHLISPVVTHDLAIGPDLLLILGTSLKVHGLKVMVRQFAKAVHTKGGKVVFINFTKPPESTWGDVIDYWVQWDCDAWVDNLKERIPIFWLPPGTVLPEPPKKRKRESVGGETKKKAAKAASEKKSKKKKEKEQNGDEGASESKSLKDAVKIGASLATNPTVVAEQANTSADINTTATGSLSDLATTTAEEQSNETKAKGPTTAKPQTPQKPNANRPKGIKEDKANGAYLSWKIMDSLRSISGRPAPPPMELPSVAATRAAAAATARIKRNEAAKARRQRKSAPAALTRPAPSDLDPIPETTPVQFTTPQGVNSISQSSPPPPVTTPPSMYVAQPQPRPQPDAARLLLAGTILEAVKSNPRRRKRKTIDGEEVVLPCVNSRGPSKQRPGAKNPKPYQPRGKENTRARISTTPVPIPNIPHATHPPTATRPPRLENGVCPPASLPLLKPAPVTAYTESLSLPPLRQPISPTSSRFPKPVPMEPLSSPRGPLTSISANLRSPMSEFRADPFFLADPSVQWARTSWGPSGWEGGHAAWG